MRIIFAAFLLFCYCLATAQQQLPAKIASIPCQNWLATPSEPSYVTVGDMDVAGTQLTVEATVMRTSFFSNGVFTESDIVSKHTGPADANYLLRPGRAIITTSNGFFATPEVCDFKLNKRYHVAMTYDGVSLKYYRNGFLMTSMPATGTLFQNNVTAAIGLLSGNNLNENFIGYINEVKIWNVARNQAQLRAFMNIPLPSPTTQSGLVAYYSFDNLINKQGNAAWNGTLNGSASINATNPICNFIADSCDIEATSDTVINLYTAINALNVCKNTLTVQNSAGYNSGDTVMLIQMGGAIADTTNTAAFGSIINLKNAGNYEFNVIKSVNGNTIELLNSFVRQFDPSAKVQLIRVPYFTNFSTGKKLTADPWDGIKGGVLVLTVKDKIELKTDIDVSGKGFLPGTGVNRASNTILCGQDDYFYSEDAQVLSNAKGTGIVNLMNDKSFGKGAAINAGGGGNSYKAGGGGGGNYGAGGFGGAEFANCGQTGIDNRGRGAYRINYFDFTDKIFMGGSGGSGHANSNGGFIGNGGNGGGIIILRAASITTNGHFIISNGNNAPECGSTDVRCYEGMGGGGGGGGIAANIETFNDETFFVFNGGKGGNMTAVYDGEVGPGGGGGGGIFLFGQNTLPSNVQLISAPGRFGELTAFGPSSWGATYGEAGNAVGNRPMPVTNILFKQNIDSVRFTTARTGCKSFSFTGIPYVTNLAAATWAWDFGDGTTANTKNTSHTYTGSGPFDVKLLLTDLNGCKDSVLQNIALSSVTVDADPDTAYCSNIAVKRTLHATGTGPWQWTPAMFLNNPAAQNPVATISSTTKFYVTVADALGCQGIDSITITVKPAPVVKSIEDAAICKGDPLLMPTSGAATYTWAPATYVNNPVGANPSFIGTISQAMYVTGTAANGCTAKDTVNVTVKPLPLVVSIPDSSICESQTIALTTTGAVSYSWSPVAGLSNAGSSAPSFSASHGNEVYHVTGTGANGCIGKDTVRITIRNRSALIAPPAKEMCFKTSVQLNGNNGNNVEYLWAPAGSLNNATIINPTASPSATQIYTLTVTDRICSYESNFSMTVTVNPLPVIKAAKTNDISCSLKTSKLSATGGTSYTWSPAASLSGAGTPNPVASPSVSTLYSVIGKDSKGCLNNDTVRVIVKNGLGGYGIPNTFTPNNDSRNECFGVQHWGDVQAFYFIIYNRYGEKVFETNNPNICWNGKYKGQPAEPGGYAYYIKGIIGCGPIERKGNVLLVR